MNSVKRVAQTYNVKKKKKSAIKMLRGTNKMLLRDHLKDNFKIYYSA